MAAAARIGADGVEHLEERPVALPVLLGQITDNGREVAPGGRSMRELRDRRHRRPGERQHDRPLGVAADHRRQLKEVADQHHLEAAERAAQASDMAADGVDQG